MSRNMSENDLPSDMLSHYRSGTEAQRLTIGRSRLELVRTQDILDRYLPSPPAVVYDIGGGPGIYARWLAKIGYEVHLVDPVPLHIEQARDASEAQPNHRITSIAVGDARRLARPDGSVDAALLFGPLYHLTERTDRLTALQEVHRVLKPGGSLFAVAISRFASTLDGLIKGFLDDPQFAQIAEQDLRDGQHRNPTNHPFYFTTAFFHHPDELKAEIEEVGFRYEATLSIEGPGWLLQNFEDHWSDEARRERLLRATRSLETEASILGVSAHMMALAQKES
jgi:ubiquinone/menaquinone biosynthesis C-methylase UbiE